MRLGKKRTNERTNERTNKQQNGITNSRRRRRRRRRSGRTTQNRTEAGLSREQGKEQSRTEDLAGLTPKTSCAAPQLSDFSPDWIARLHNIHELRMRLLLQIKYASGVDNGGATAPKGAHGCIRPLPLPFPPPKKKEKKKKEKAAEPARGG